MKPIAAALLVLASMLAAAPAKAGGGARNVLVVVNQGSAESLEIGSHYLYARGVPAANLCRLDTTAALLTDKATYQAEIEAPIKSCIAASPYASRIDYLVLTRGLPVRVDFPDRTAPPAQPVATTALLQAMDTALAGKDQEVAAPCYDASRCFLNCLLPCNPGFLSYPNPYRKQDTWFAHAKSFGGDNLYIATMLSGYWSEDAIALVDRSIASDAAPPSAGGGVFYFEDSQAGAAGIRNGDYPQAVANLQARGLAASHVLDTDPNLQGSAVASYLNGGVYSALVESDIDSCTYPPGALVDVLESAGLFVENFDPDQAPTQVPVTAWVRAGITGAHGTVGEPYNVAFPDGFLLDPYVQGYNLGETFYQDIPYLYWMNLVLGDPLAAPYATPPAVTIQSPAAQSTVSGTTQLAAMATTPKPEGIAQVELFVDDTLVLTAASASAQTMWDSTAVADGWHRLEAVAYEATKLSTQATAGVDFVVANRGLVVAIADPPGGTRVGPTFPVTVTASPAITSVAVAAEGLTLATRTGSSPFVVSIDSTRLGRGRHTLVATGVDAAANAARSAGVDVIVVNPPRLHALDPASGPTGGGTPVAIDGWDFEPDVQVRFAARAAAAVTRKDANHLIATSPPGAAGAVDVTIANPLGLTLVIPGRFTYAAPPCPLTTPVAAIRAARAAGNRVQLGWAPPADPCLASYRVFAAVDPPVPPAFPVDYADVTAEDEDGDAGGNPSFMHVMPGGNLVLYQVAGVGTDGGLGPP